RRKKSLQKMLYKTAYLFSYKQRKTKQGLKKQPRLPESIDKLKQGL
ncbi:unnamed protein product, partial [marine sediment metagenome]